MNGKSLSYYLLFVFLFCGCFYSCLQDESFSGYDKKDRFFKTDGADDWLRSIAERLRQKNDSTDFVAGFVSKYGYPLWKDAYLFPEGDKSVYAVPIKSTTPKAEVEAIWYFSAGTNRTDYRIYTREMADRIAAQTSGDGIEDTWMFDYFTRNALHKDPASGLFFLSSETVTSRVSTIYVENTFCSHVIAYTGNGENFVDHGYNCWTSPGGYFVIDDEGNGSITDGGGGGGGGDGDSSCSSATAASVAPKAYNIFRNSKMTEQNWKNLEVMLDRIIKDCLGGELYNGLKSFLKGKTLTIQFKAGTDGGFGMQGESVGIALGMQMESNQLLHEMFHAYQAYQSTLAQYNISLLNNEIEAHYAQYLYTSRLPEYKGSKWEKRDFYDLRRKSIKKLATYLDMKGNLLPGVTNDLLNIEIISRVTPALRAAGYTEDKYPWNDFLSGIANFKNLNKLTINCK